LRCAVVRGPVRRPVRVGDQVVERTADDVLGELLRQEGPLPADALLDRVDDVPARYVSSDPGTWLSESFRDLASVVGAVAAAHPAPSGDAGAARTMWQRVKHLGHTADIDRFAVISAPTFSDHQVMTGENRQRPCGIDMFRYLAET